MDDKDKNTKNSSSVRKIVVFVLVFTSLCCILLWDMRKVQKMSLVIHNDHASMWEPMNDTLIKQWLTPLDLCMLKVDQPNVDLKSYKAKNCSKVAGTMGLVTQKLYCNIGSSLGKRCSPPLSTRSFFTYKLRSNHLSDPTSQLLSISLKAIAESGKPIIFIGDGISKQNQDALVCELLRKDKVYIIGNMAEETSQLVSTFTIRWRERNLKLDVIYIKMNHLLDSKPSRHKRKLNDSGSNKKIDKVISNQTIIKNIININNNNKSNKTTVTTKINQTNSTLSFHEIKTLVDQYLDKYKHVVIVANIGVWYNVREKFRNDLSLLLNWLNQLVEDNPKNLVFYRETSAQHWNNSLNGYYNPESLSVNNGSCVAISDFTYDIDWRNHDLYHILENDHLQYIHIIPFRDLTLPLYNMHPSNIVSQDCTHFCYFPQMWQSVWYDMYSIIMNETWSNHSSSNYHTPALLLQQQQQQKQQIRHLNFNKVGNTLRKND